MGLPGSGGRRSRRPAITIWLLAAVLSGLSLSNAFAAGDTPAAAAEPATQSINPTGKAINMSVPFKDGKQTLGDVNVRIATDSTVHVAKAALAEKLSPLLDEKTRRVIAWREFDAIAPSATDDPYGGVLA